MDWIGMMIFVAPSASQVSIPSSMMRHSIRTYAGAMQTTNLCRSSFCTSSTCTTNDFDALRTVLTLKLLGLLF